MALKIKGRGCIEAVRKGVWRVRFCLGRDPLHPGRYLYSPSRMAYGAKSEAYRVADEYKRELEDDNVVNPDELTVREYAQLFHDQHVAKIKSPLAYERERQTIAHIDELFGDYRLEELSPIIIKATYARARGGMSEMGLHQLHQKLKQIMNEAVNDDLLVKNPCNKISIPRPAIVHERKSMSPEEAARLRRILMSGEPTANTVAVTLALATGMRRGEVMGLMWKNVDLAGFQLYVEYQYTSDRALRAPKSKKSVRWLSLDGGTVERLARWKELQPTLYPVKIGKDSPRRHRRARGLLRPDELLALVPRFLRGERLRPLREAGELARREGREAIP